MVGTSIFNWLLDGDIRPEQLPHPAEYLVTHVQHDELTAAPSERRKLLFEQLGSLKPATALTESMVVGISRVGAGKNSDGEKYEILLAALERKKKKKNNPCDALIAETALKNNLTLISADNNLCAVMREAGGSVIDFKKPVQTKST